MAGADRSGPRRHVQLRLAGEPVGLRIRSAQQINPEWQALDRGDEIRLVRRGWLGLRDGYVLRVVQLEPARNLVLYDDTFKSVWSFHIRPLGTNRCRLLSRSRGRRAAGPQAVLSEALDPITF